MKEKKRLLRVTTVSGSLRKLLEGQLKFMTSHFEVHACSSKSGGHLPMIAERENVTTHEVAMERGISPIKDLKSIIDMYRVIKKIKPHIIHTHTPKAGMIGMIAAYVARIPVRLHTVAGMPLETTVGFKRRILLLIEKLIYSLATKVYPNSQGLLSFILDNNLSRADKLKIIGYGSSNGINLNYFKDSEITSEILKETEEKYSFNKETFKFLFIGRILEDKGINELCKAFERLSKETKNIQLVILGRREDGLNPISQESMEILDNNEHILLTGYVNDIRPFLILSDAFVFPTYREGLPNVLLQAQSFDLPTIATRVTGNTDIIDDGFNGVLISHKNENELFDAMKSIYYDGELRERISNNSRSRINERYDQKKLWNLIYQEYQTMLT